MEDKKRSGEELFNLRSDFRPPYFPELMSRGPKIIKFQKIKNTPSLLKCFKSIKKSKQNQKVKILDILMILAGAQ